MKIDFSNVQQMSTVVPEGVYSVVVEKIEWAGDEKLYYNWQFNIINADDPENKENVSSRKLWAITSIKPKALWKLQQFLEALGEDANAIVSADYDFDPEQWVGSECKVLVKHREYQGNTMCDVDSILASSAQAQLDLFK